MASQDDELTLEALDEQIDALARAPQSLPTDGQQTPTSQLIQHLSHLYQEEQATAQAVDTVRRRLQERGAVPAQQPQRASRSGQPRWQESGPPPQAYTPAAPARRGPSTRLLTIAAAVLLLVVVSGLVAGLVLVRQHGPVISTQPTVKPGQTVQPTQPPTPAEIAYISDDNVWTMTWPGGTPKHLTTDGVPTSRYSSLTWSPDGSLLAAVKSTVSAGIGSIVIMKPDGSVVANTAYSLTGGWYDTPAVWSPDGTMLAFRGDSDVVSPSGNNTGKLFILDPHTGKTEKTLTYNLGIGCGAIPPSPLSETILVAHHDIHSGSLDTFVWAPDQRSMLVSYGCSGQVAQVDLSTGATTLPYPLYGSYQPGGNLILGYWSDGTLGLTDLSADHVRALVKAEPYVDPPKYVIRLGVAIWTNDGQTIYYEHDDSIWRIGVDGANPRQVVAGTALDSQQNATIQLVPSPSPDGQMLLYLQASGSNRNGGGDPTIQPTPIVPLTSQWYIAQADGSNPQPLPQGISEAVWRPAK